MAKVYKKPLKLDLKKGALHKALWVSQDKKIPAKKEEIKKTDTPLMKKRKQFAINAKKWNKTWPKK